MDGLRQVSTLPQALADRVRRDGARPLVTYIRPTQRMELSAASLANAVAKTAGLLRDDLDVEPGDEVAVHLPLHWQAAVWFGACASVAAICRPGASQGEVGVATAADIERISTCHERVAVSLAAFGLPEGVDLPTGVIEAAVAMRAHPDEFQAFEPVTPNTIALIASGSTDEASVPWTQADIVELAAQRARDWSLHSGGRLLITDDADMERADTWTALLAVPLVTDASVVLASGLADADLDAVISTEGITARATW